MFNKPINRRLAPLYIGRFFANFVLWYSIEKLFMQSIGIDIATIGLLAAVYAAASFLMEAPSGILADRWSRKGVMMLSGLALAVSSLLGYFSTDVTLYLFAALAWGIFDALASGTSDSMIYDALLDEQIDTKHFNRYLSMTQIISGVGLVLGALLGAYVASQSSLNIPYLITVPTALLAVISYAFFKDSTRQHADPDAKLLTHTKNTFRVVFRNANLTYILVSLICISVAGGVIGEMSQTWFLAVNFTTAQFGIASAAIMLIWGLSGVAALLIANRTRVVFFSLLAIVGTLGFIFSRNLFVITVALCIVGIIAQGLQVYLTSLVHDHLPSKYRAGAGSAINTARRLIFIPFVVLFGFIAQYASIFTASWMITAMLCVALVTELSVKRRSMRRV